MSEKPTAAKLQIRDGYGVLFVGHADAAALVGELPDGAHSVSDPATADAAVIFVADRAELDERIVGLSELTAARAVWFCYPKGNTTNINRDSIRGQLDEAGWEVVTAVSVDATWSALRAKHVG
jgi:hypothetical protein